MISQIEIDTILAPALKQIDSAALTLSSAPRWRVHRFVADVRNNTHASIKSQFPALDDETVARIVDRVVERIEERVDRWCEIAEAGGTA
jgi:chorismate mutase